MQLNKTGINAEAGKTAGISAKNVPEAKAALLPQANIQTKTIDTQAARSLASLIASSGLPQDKLSASILSFARFFSLAFKPEQLAAIRRQAMGAPAQQNAAAAQTAAQTAAGKLPADFLTEKARAVFSLAAAAAESKGVELRPNALENYAKAVDLDVVDPDQHKKHNGEKRGEEREKEKRNKDRNEKEEKIESISAAGARKIALESAENNPLLQIMNKLPCKNGQRWIALPFEFSQNGKDYRVSMRVLIERETVVFMALDINEQLVMSNENYQSFALEFASNKVKKLTYYNQSLDNVKTQRSIKKDLAEIFKIPVENVFVKIIENGDMLIPEADYGEELLRFIDEAV